MQLGGKGSLSPFQKPRRAAFRGCRGMGYTTRGGWKLPEGSALIPSPLSVTTFWEKRELPRFSLSWDSCRAPGWTNIPQRNQGPCPQNAASPGGSSPVIPETLVLDLGVVLKSRSPHSAHRGPQSQGSLWEHCLCLSPHGIVEPFPGAGAWGSSPSARCSDTHLLRCLPSVLSEMGLRFPLKANRRAGTRGLSPHCPQPANKPPATPLRPQSPGGHLLPCVPFPASALCAPGLAVVGVTAEACDANMPLPPEDAQVSHRPAENSLSPSAWDWASQPSGAAATWLCLCAWASPPGPHRLRLLAAGSELLPLPTTCVAPPSLPGWPPCPSSIPAFHSPLARGVLASGLWLVSPSLLPGLNAPWPGRSSPPSRALGAGAGCFGMAPRVLDHCQTRQGACATLGFCCRYGS